MKEDLSITAAQKLRLLTQWQWPNSLDAGVPAETKIVPMAAAECFRVFDNVRIVHEQSFVVVDRPLPA